MKDILDQVAQSTEAAAVGKGAIVAGSAGSLIFGISSDVIGVVASIIIALCGLGISIWYHRERLKILRAQGKDSE